MTTETTETTETAELRRVLNLALDELEKQRAIVVPLARQLGRCEEAFRIILQQKSAAKCHVTARRMRDELAALGKKASKQ